MTSATAPQGVVLRLRDDVDVSRGDTIVPTTAHPAVTRVVEATLCWMHERPLEAGRKLLVQHHTAVLMASVTAIVHKTNVATFESIGTDTAQLNDIVRVQLKTAGPLVVDDYRQNRATGAFILVDDQTGETLAAGLVKETNPELFATPVPAEPAFSI